LLDFILPQNNLDSQDYSAGGLFRVIFFEFICRWECKNKGGISFPLYLFSALFKGQIVKGHFLAKGQFSLSFRINTETPMIIVVIINKCIGFLTIPNCRNINTIAAITIIKIEIIAYPLFCHST